VPEALTRENTCRIETNRDAKTASNRGTVRNHESRRHFDGDMLQSLRTAVYGEMMAEGARMVARPADLPDYDNPPVNEVVIGIQFVPVDVTGAHIGLFWEGLRSEFPKASEQPALEPRIEILQPLRFAPPMLQFGSWHGSRHWLTSEDDVQLIQIQADRLIYNWRRGPNNATYPHFEALQEKFHEIGERWLGFLVNWGQVFRITQWELSYINHIVTPNGKPTLADAISFLSGELNEAMGGPLDAGRLEAQRILTEGGSPWARMYVSINTGIRSDQIPLIAIELTVRGPVEGEDAWGITHDLLRKARRQIVLAFDTLTTPKMHLIWGKRK